MPSLIFKTPIALIMAGILWAILLFAASTAKGQIDPCTQGCIDELHACQSSTPYSYNHCQKQYLNCLKRQCGITVKGH